MLCHVQTRKNYCSALKKLAIKQLNFGTVASNGSADPGVPILASDERRSKGSFVSERMVICYQTSSILIQSMRSQWRICGKWRGVSSHIIVDEALQFNWKKRKTLGQPLLVVIWYGSPSISAGSAKEKNKNLLTPSMKKAQNHYGELVSMDKVLAICEWGCVLCN